MTALRSTALLAGLLALSCGPSRPGVPVPDELEVAIANQPFLLLEQAHPTPEGNSERERRMLELFAEVGCQRLEQQPLERPMPSRVICTLPGESTSTVLVTANFEEPVGRRYRDNWVGAAMLPSLYRSLGIIPRHHTYVFVAFSDERQSLAGSPTASLHMLRRLPPAERKSIVALVTVKGLGLDVSAVWEPVADPNLHVDLYSVSRSLQLPMRRIDFSDERSRLPSTGVPSILIGVADRQIGEYLDSFRLVAAYLSYIDQTLEHRRRQGRQPSAL